MHESHRTLSWRRTGRVRGATLLGAWLCAALLAGCGGSGTETSSTTESAPGAAPSPSAPSRAAPTAASGQATDPPPAVADMEPCPDDADKPFSRKVRGYEVSGHSRGTSKIVVILSHQSRGTPCDLAALGARLAAEGYRVVSWTADPYPDVPSLLTVVQAERRRGARGLVLVGASTGASSSLVAAGRAQPPVDGVVALSPSEYAQTPGDVDAAAARYRGPLLLGAGEQDPDSPELVRHIAQTHRGPEQVAIVEGVPAHGKELVDRRDSETTEQVVAFVAAAVK